VLQKLLFFLKGEKLMKKAIAVLSLPLLILLTFGLAFPQGVVTGLIIDAQHLQFTPSASPKILDEDGREIYGSAYLDKAWVEKHGVVGYAPNLSEAKANARVAGNPVVVKALRVTGANNRDLILSDQDARKVRELSKNLNFLDNAKVIVVVP
jgi:hypothetical protein